MAVVDPGFPKVSANLLFGHFPRKLYDKSMKKFWPGGGGGASLAPLDPPLHGNLSQKDYDKFITKQIN